MLQIIMDGMGIFCAHIAIYNKILSILIVPGVFKNVSSKSIYYGNVGNKVLRFEIINLNHKR